MTFMSCSMVRSSGISVRLVGERIRRRACGACKMFVVGSQRGRGRRLVVFAAKRKKHSKKRPWWVRWFSDVEEDDESWFDESTDDNALGGADGEEGAVSEDEKFEAWKRKAEAIVELREARQEALNADGRSWEDWIGGDSSSWDGDWGGDTGTAGQITDDPTEIVKEKGFIEAFRDSISEDDDDMLFEDRVFKYASTNSAKFLAILILVPLAVDFVVHDYVLMPFLDRYVQKVPLAAEILDVRRSQKLQMVKDLKIESARLRYEVEIGKSPPLTDEELWWELRHKAIEMRDEWRLENRKAFANIWSDIVCGIVLFLLIYFNESKVALLKFTGYKLFNNISDSGKAFLIILTADISLGYHSEAGWQTLIEVFLEHYGLEVDQAAITIFIGVVPVLVDAFVKLWLFKYLPRLSANVTNILREMRRH